MELETEQTLPGFKEPHVPTYCHSAFRRNLPKVQDPSRGLGFCIESVCTCNYCHEFRNRGISGVST